MNTTDRWFGRCRNYWVGRIDSRPLSIFRIGIALILLKDALLHIPVAGVFYSDTGILPRAVSWGMVTHLGHLSVLDLLPQTWMATAFFAVWSGVALCLLIGFRARLMAVLNFVLIVSIHARNPYVLSGADDMLRLLSFWMIFVPLDHHYVVPVGRYRAAPPRSSSPQTTYALPVRLIQLQVAIAYLAAGLSKLPGETWRSGEAIFYVLQLESYLRPFGQWLAHNSPLWFLSLLTYGVLIGELVFIFLAFAPFWQPLLRYVAIAAMASMHLGIAIAMSTPLLDFVPVFGISYVLFLTPLPLPRAEPNESSVVHTKIKIVESALLVLLMGLVIWQNADTLGSMGQGPSASKLPGALRSGLQNLGLAQDWSLFAPDPLRTDPYLAMVGAFENNTTLDLRTGQPFELAVAPIASGLTDYRWGNFNVQMFVRRPESIFETWSVYYCRQYNMLGSRASSPRLIAVQTRAVYRLSHTPDQRLNPIQDDLLWLHAC